MSCGKVIATINTGVNPAGIAITPGGRYCYVANNNNYSINGQDSVTVIDLSLGITIKTIYMMSHLMNHIQLLLIKMEVEHM